jgi:predicted KAP-like P-loop ATPase
VSRRPSLLAPRCHPACPEHRRGERSEGSAFSFLRRALVPQLALSGVAKGVLKNSVVCLAVNYWKERYRRLCKTQRHLSGVGGSPRTKGGSSPNAEADFSFGRLPNGGHPWPCNNTMVYPSFSMNEPSNNLTNPPRREHPFSSERPIQTLAEDELGRGGFAAAVAKVIGQWGNRDSLILAIYGPWGSGKSSLKNMILDSLQKQDNKTIVLEFNPWEWAGQEKVFEGFFSELSTKLGSTNPSEKAAKAAKKMRMYGAMLSAAASIYGLVRWLIVGFLALIGVFGLAPLLHSSSLLSVLKIIGGLALFAALFLATFGDTGDKLAAYLGAKAEATRRSVDELRKELQTLLATLDNNVLVVIDDVDRLTPSGIRTVFQLVKANADFPNLVYLVLFQRDTIEKALAGMGGAGEVDGSQFLDKVVQVGFDIPKLSPRTIEESIESAVSRIVQGNPAQERFDTQRWGKLFISAIRPYFRTLRDVKRFINTLSFHFELYRNGVTFNANPVDLIALEVLRQFEAPLYNELFKAQEMLTGAPRAALGRNFSLEGPNQAEILSKIAYRQQEARNILSNIFPPFAWALAETQRRSTAGAPHAAQYRKEWLKDLRACHPDVFERYFKFSLSVEDLSESEMSDLLAVVGDRNGLVQKLRDLAEKGLLGAAVMRLGAQNPSISGEGAVPFVVGLLDVEKELLGQRSSRGVATVPISIQAALLISSVLRQVPPDMRGVILQKAIEQTTALYLPMIISEASDKQAVDPLVSDEDSKLLQELCIQKIQAVKQSTKLLAHPLLRYILRNWSRWGSEEEVSEWFAQNAKFEDTLLILLNAFVESMNDMTLEGRTVRVLYRFALEDFARYINPDVLAERIRGLATSGNEHLWLYRLFLRTFDEWKATGQYPYPQKLDEWTTLESP